MSIIMKVKAICNSQFSKLCYHNLEALGLIICNRVMETDVQSVGQLALQKKQFEKPLSLLFFLLLYHFTKIHKKHWHRCMVFYNFLFLQVVHIYDNKINDFLGQTSMIFLLLSHLRSLAYCTIPLRIFALLNVAYGPADNVALELGPFQRINVKILHNVQLPTVGQCVFSK